MPLLGGEKTKNLIKSGEWSSRVSLVENVTLQKFFLLH